jgi:hypothetical protein
MPLPKKIDTSETDSQERPSLPFSPFAEFAVAGMAAFRAVEDVAVRMLGSAPLARKPEVPRVGEYYADYSELTSEEIAADDPKCAELFANSKPSSR